MTKFCTKPIEMIPSELLEHALLKLEKKLSRGTKNMGIIPSLRYSQNIEERIEMYKTAIENLKFYKL